MALAPVLRMAIGGKGEGRQTSLEHFAVIPARHGMALVLRQWRSVWILDVFEDGVG